MPCALEGLENHSLELQNMFQAQTNLDTSEL